MPRDRENSEASRRESLRQVNRYGLSRRIPAPIAREVRQRCGFGCVVCGFFIYTYHHFDPPFPQAREHNPKGITLLCTRCHDNATKKLLSNDTIKKAVIAPKCLEHGFSHFPLEVGKHFPVILLGNSTFVGNPTIIRAFGTRLFGVDKPERPSGPYRISARFYDREGHEACRIVENEWQGLASSWDITSVGNEFTIRRAHGEIALQMHPNPPDALVIDRLNMIYRSFRIVVEADGRTTTFLPDGRMWFQLNGAVLTGNDAVIVIE